MWYSDKWHDGGWAWGMWFIPVIWILIMAGVVVALIFLVRAVSHDRPSPISQSATTQPPTSASDEAREILRRRYAAGEIEREEYLRKLDDLGP